MKDLTIMITTYNRKERLMRMLNSIMIQGRYEDYIILVVDNHSDDYDWSDILSKYPKQFQDNIKIEVRHFNCGMTCNISSCFLLVETKWVLFLSDDDEMLPGSLERILFDIKKYDNFGVVHYTISNKKKHDDQDIGSIDEYISYYRNYPFKGDIIFLTQLYNLSVMRKYLGLFTTYAYSYVSFNLPMYYGLIDQEFKIRMSSSSIVNYIEPDAGTGWSRLPVALGMCSFMDIPLNISFKKKKDLYQLFSNDFTIYRMLRCLSDVPDKEERRFFFRKINSHFYKPFSKTQSLIFMLLYYLYHYCGVNVVAMYDKKRNINNV